MIRLTPLLALSLALVSCGPPAPPAGTEKAEPSPPADQPIRALERREIANDFFVVVLDASVSPARYPDFARELCGERGFCKVGVWTDASLLPRGFPMTDREVAGEMFQYGLNRDTGYEATIWNCQVNPQDDPSNCGLGTN